MKDCGTCLYQPEWKKKRRYEANESGNCKFPLPPTVKIYPIIKISNQIFMIEGKQVVGCACWKRKEV